MPRFARALIRLSQFCCGRMPFLPAEVGRDEVVHLIRPAPHTHVVPLIVPVRDRTAVAVRLLEVEDVERMTSSAEQGGEVGHRHWSPIRSRAFNRKFVPWLM
jgi:hypothetical protein